LPDDAPSPEDRFVSNRQNRFCATLVFIVDNSDTRWHIEFAAAQPGGLPVSKILLVDDDDNIILSVEEILTRNGYIVDIANRVEDADAMLAGFTFDLIILDWMLPGITGIDFLAKIRARGITTPVIMLTGMGESENKIRGLETGADDYLTKPFNREELLSRVRAVLRRPAMISQGSELQVSGVLLDTKSLKVTWHNKELQLTRQEYQLLELLMRNKNEVFSHDALVERAWSSFSESSPDTVRTHMSRLRRKFEEISDQPCPIRTVYGKGYMFVSENKA
jgi:DNA-binding response OmpR family regulator